jgi:hypothetical protein
MGSERGADEGAVAVEQLAARAAPAPHEHHAQAVIARKDLARPRQGGGAVGDHVGRRPGHLGLARRVDGEGLDVDDVRLVGRCRRDRVGRQRAGERELAAEPPQERQVLAVGRRVELDEPRVQLGVGDSREQGA